MFQEKAGRLSDEDVRVQSSFDWRSLLMMTTPALVGQSLLREHSFRPSSVIDLMFLMLMVSDEEK